MSLKETRPAACLAGDIGRGVLTPVAATNAAARIPPRLTRFRTRDFRRSSRQTIPPSPQPSFPVRFLGSILARCLSSGPHTVDELINPYLLGKSRADLTIA